MSEPCQSKPRDNPGTTMIFDTLPATTGARDSTLQNVGNGETWRKRLRAIGIGMACAAGIVGILIGFWALLRIHGAQLSVGLLS